MVIYKPFNGLYDMDKTKDKEFSSRQMWTIFFMCDPDEDRNIFFRIPFSQRQEMLSDTFVPDLDWENPVFKGCLEQYPFECMNAVQRALAAEKDQLRKRAKLIQDTELSLDRVDDKGKKIPGTATQINMLQKDALRIYEAYEQIEAKFLAQKSISAVHGGDKMTKTEKGEMW
jgi:hypothetical protein